MTSVDPRSPADLRLATAGVVFYLDDLQEVSETCHRFKFSRDLDLDTLDAKDQCNMTNPRFDSSVTEFSHCPFTSSSSGIS